MSLFNGMNIKKDNWFEVFSACLGQSIAIQRNCSLYVVKDNDWNLDFPKRVITFGATSFPIQFIGSESTVTNTWLWGWQNVNQFDDSLLIFANEIKRKGEKWRLEPLTTPEFDLNKTFSGHNIAIVSCAISDERMCYYRCVHEDGAIMVAFSGVPQEVFSKLNVAQFSAVAAQCIQQFYVDHTIFIESFLRWNNTPFEYCGDNLIAHFEDVDLIISFEKTGDFKRITSIKTDD